MIITTTFLLMVAAVVGAVILITKIGAVAAKAIELADA